MLWSMGSPTVRHNRVTKQQQQQSGELLIHVKDYDIACLFVSSYLYSKLLDNPISSDFLTSVPTLSWY